MATTREKLGTQAHEVSDDLKKMGGIVREAAQETFGQARENAVEYYEHGRDKVHGVASAFENYVRERPIKSVLIATGIGLLFGRYWMRR